MTEPSIEELADALFEIAGEQICALEMMRHRAASTGLPQCHRPTAAEVERMARRTLCIVNAHGELRRQLTGSVAGA